MTDLLTALYEFLCRRRMGRVWDDPDYSAFCACAQRREQALRDRLYPEGVQLLDDLLYELSCQHATEQEAIFQSSLALCRELNGLLNP